MWASSSITFQRPLHVGEDITRHSRVAGVNVKEGRTGVLCFVTVRHSWDAAGKRAIEEEQTIVYREAETGQACPPAAETAPDGATIRKVQPTPPLLFRYSAITFNTHRIHYDRSYAIEVEKYPGLVVHGPLQATMLMSMAMDVAGGRRPSSFRFRASSPVFEKDPLCLHAGTLEGNSLRLWSARPGGPVAMSVEAQWS
jgi:3-methylfumaryl-CoA hydratase